MGTESSTTKFTLYYRNILLQRKDCAGPSGWRFESTTEASEETLTWPNLARRSYPSGRNERSLIGCRQPTSLLIDYDDVQSIVVNVSYVAKHAFCAPHL